MSLTSDLFQLTVAPTIKSRFHLSLNFNCLKGTYSKPSQVSKIGLFVKKSPS